MRILSFLIFIAVSGYFIKIGHPHGEGFKISCSVCHSAESWKLDMEVYSFDHNKTRFPLTGTHSSTGCRKCHVSLVFTDAGETCNACHQDIHQSTTGQDCERCHSTDTWLVNDVTRIHQMSRFPLLGPHRTADCRDCHKSESLVRFEVLGIECIDCHRTEYQSTTNPAHASAGFSEDCGSCHKLTSFSWSGAGFSHGFFPLTLGHAGLKCSDCHRDGPYTTASPECWSCHQDDYNNATNVNHVTAGFPHTCQLCHSTQPGWSPASFTQHDSQYFPIYSGTHRGEWNSCAQCHQDPGNFSRFTCLSCHEHNKSSTDSHHDEVSGYSYTSTACIHCHPDGRAEDR